MAFLDNTGLSRLWQHILALAADLTPKSRKINGKPLSSDVTITAADLGLEQAMKFLGTSGIAISDGDTDPNITVGGQAVVAELGNVVLYNGKEYVFSSAGWEELGDEGSHALKSITISAGNGLTGGGDLSANRTISAKAGTGITVNSSGIHNAGVRAITKSGSSISVNTNGTTSTIGFTASDVDAYSKTEIDAMVFITVDDIDTICGASIVAATEVTY